MELCVRVDASRPNADILSGIQYVLLDCDGVLWSGDLLLPGVQESLAELRARGIQLRFVTNNATMSRPEMIAAKFDHFGIPCAEHEVLSSPFAAQVALRKAGSSCDGTGFDRGNVLVLGNKGLHAELQPALAPGVFTYGLELHGADPAGPFISAHAPYDMKAVARAWNEPLLPAPRSTVWSGKTPSVTLAELNFGAVVIGLDFNFTPTTLALACMVLQQHDRVPGAQRALFIATNKDPQIAIGAQGWLLPGAGSLVTCLEYASGRSADVVCGKPQVDLFHLLQGAEEARTGVPLRADQCLMVGDRLSTDIAFGNGAGTRTLFVLCGCETLDDIPALPTRDATSQLLVPHFIAENLRAAVIASRV